MSSYVQLSIYILCIGFSFVLLWFVDFTKFIRTDKRAYAILVYAFLSLALGFAVGKLFIELGELFRTFA